MRIGAICDVNAAANYRVRYPLLAMQWRGHETLWPDDAGRAPLHELLRCDVVLIYRLSSPDVQSTVAQLKRRGVGVVWDNDDDFRNVPKNRRNRQATGGRSNAQIFASMVRTASAAHSYVVTTEELATLFKAHGAPRARVIENYILPVPRAQHEHGGKASDGVTVGWIAGMEHRHDATGLRINETLLALQMKHPSLRVISVGVELQLNERYEHLPMVPFDDLPQVISRFDIGIAPLLDTAFNRSRSNIKLKEYAASGVPWLGSPVGPYADAGEHQGGRLVPDDHWLEELDALVDDPLARRRLAERGAAWAETQTFEAVVDEYETLLAEAVLRASGRPAAMPVAAPLVEGSAPARPSRLVARLPRWFSSRAQSG